MPQTQPPAEPITHETRFVLTDAAMSYLRAFPWTEEDERRMQEQEAAEVHADDRRHLAACQGQIAH